MNFDENCANSCLKNKRSAIVTILPNFSIVSKIAAEVNVIKVIFLRTKLWMKMWYSDLGKHFQPCLTFMGEA